MFDYIPTDWTDPSGATGLPTREASRTLEVYRLSSVLCISVDQINDY